MNRKTISFILTILILNSFFDMKMVASAGILGKTTTKKTTKK